MKTGYLRFYCLLAAIMMNLLVYLPSAHSLEVTASIDRESIYLDETVNLTLAAEGDNSGQLSPDLDSLRENFDILSQSMQTSIQVTLNQGMKVSNSWVVGLKPKNLGKIIIPGISIGGEFTKALELEVSEYTKTVPKVGENIFLEVEVTENKPYVQSEFIYIVRLYYVGSIFEHHLSEPTVPFAIVQILGPERMYQATRESVQYNVTERRYSIFPERSGLQEIPPVEFNGMVVDFGYPDIFPIEPYNRLSSESVQINVRPKPDAFTGSTWLPAKDLQLSDSWGGRRPDFEIGKLESRQITINAVGLKSVQLPSPTFEENQSARIYGSNPNLRNERLFDSTVGQRIEEFVIIPRQIEDLVIPEFKVVWWDIDEDREKVATLPMISSAVAASAQEIPTVSTGESESTLESTNLNQLLSSGNQMWMFISIGMLVMWILTVVIWYVSRKFHSSRKDDSLNFETQVSTIRQVSREVRQACWQGDAEQVTTALLKWSQLNWPNHPPRNLIELGRRIDSNELSEELEILDRTRYSGESSTWDGKKFWRLFSRLNSAAANTGKHSKLLTFFRKSNQSLEDLWPEHESSTG